MSRVITPDEMALFVAAFVSLSIAVAIINVTAAAIFKRAAGWLRERNAGTEARRVAVASGALLADESKGGGQ